MVESAEKRYVFVLDESNSSVAQKVHVTTLDMDVADFISHVMFAPQYIRDVGGWSVAKSGRASLLEAGTKKPVEADKSLRYYAEMRPERVASFILQGFCVYCANGGANGCANRIADCHAAYVDKLVVHGTCVRVLSAHFTAVPSTSATQLLYDAILKQQLEEVEKEGGAGVTHIRLQSEGAEWLQASNETLFVRDVYPCLFNLMVAEWTVDCSDKAARKGFVLYGQPGIGKSVFGDYLLYRFLRAGWIVFVMPHFDSTVGYLFMDGRVYQGDQGSMEQLHLADTWKMLGERNLVSILDSRFISNTGSRIISISSPGRMREHKNNNLLNKFQKLMVPMMSRAEMLDMWKIAFSDMKLEDVEKRMRLWGCIPRFVFYEISDEDQVNAWRDVQRVGVNEISEAIRTVTTGAKAVCCHRIIQERCYGQDVRGVSKKSWKYYMFGKVAFASEVLGAWACNKFSEKKPWDLWKVIINSAGIKDIAGSHGSKFESLLWHVLQQNVPFKVRQLGKACKPITESFTAAALRVFHTMDELAELAKEAMASDKVMLLTPSRNLCDIDGILVAAGCPIFLKATVEWECTVKGPELAAAAQVFGWNGRDSVPWSSKAVKLYFLVPEEMFAFWTETKLIRLSDTVARNATVDATLIRNTQQFAVRVPEAAMKNALKAFASRIDRPAALLPRYAVDDGIDGGEDHDCSDGDVHEGNADDDDDDDDEGDEFSEVDGFNSAPAPAVVLSGQKRKSAAGRIELGPAKRGRRD